MNIIQDQKSFLEFIRDEAKENGNLSIRGVARCCGVDHKSIIDSGDIKAQKLAKTLTGYGWQAADLIQNGFPPQAVWLCIEYFAYESKAKAEMAKQLARTFGAIGVLTTLGELKKPVQVERRLPPVRDAIDYVDAMKTVETYGNGLLKQLLKDSLIDELELQRNNSKAIAAAKKEYTIVKVRATELGYSHEQVKNGAALGRYVAQHIEPVTTERVGKYSVNHYEITPYLDEVIHAYFN